MKCFKWEGKQEIRKKMTINIIAVKNTENS